MAWTPGEPNKASDGPADGSITITPSDSTVFGKPTRAIYVGNTGNVAVRMSGDASTPIFVAVPTGGILPVSADKVLATGTTATSLVGIF